MTSDLQKSILASLIKDSYLMAKVTNLVKAEFFEDPELRLIYQKVKYHYDKYGAVPAQSSLRDAINNSTTDLIDKEAVKELVTELWEEVPEPEEFIIDKVTQFVRSNKVRSTLSEYLPRMKDEGEDILTELGEKLSDSVELEVDMEQHLVLSDTKKLPEVRRAAVGAEERSVIIQSSFNSVNRALTFGGYKYGDLAAFIAPPGTGKSFSLVNEGVYAVTQGFQVFHAFIGDMSLYDGWIRYVSNITGIYQDQLVKMTPEDQIKVIKDCNTLGYFDKVCIVSYPAESITVNQLIRDIGKYQSKLHTKFDMIIVDYPDNLVAESDMMYLSGGTIYNKLSGLAQRNRSVVLVASQPKISYYDAEIIPLEGAAESSKKQQNLDLMVTLGKPYRDFECLTGFIAKNRRGSTGDIFRVKTEFENARMNEISSLEYQKLLAEYQGGHYNE